MASEGDSGVLDLACWSAVREMVVAVHVRSVGRFDRACKQVRRDVPRDRTAVMYMLFLVGRRLRDLAGHSVTAEDIDVWATRVHQKTPVGGFGVEGFAGVMRAACQVGGGPWWFGMSALEGGAAILGELFDEFPAELDALRPELELWWMRVCPVTG